MSFLRIENLYKTFDRVVAVNLINLDIAEGEFFTLLGSSGCGKTTTLRMVGGLGETRWRRHLPRRPVPGFLRQEPFYQAGKAQHGHGVPVLCALAAHDGF